MNGELPKMKIKIVLLFLTLFIFNGCKKPITVEQQLQMVIEKNYLKNLNIKGIMVHIESPSNNLSWSGATGYSNWDETIKLNAQQPALIASITKTYVAATILKLIEQKKLSLQQPIATLLSNQTSELMIANGFNINYITVAHLMAHKSGIPDHTDTKQFLDKLKNDTQYRWTRDEQIQLSISQGKIGDPGYRFHYTDTNYLLLSEIIEQTTQKVFYESIREYLNYNEHQLNQTWFYTLEQDPATTLPLIHQYVPEAHEDSYEIDNSFDLFGGGGIAATTSDLAKFSQLLFNGQFFEHKETLNLLFTDIVAETGDIHEDYINNIPCEYYLGIQECEVNGLNSYWHSGYWGTIFRYFPKLNTTIVFYVVNEAEFEAIELDLMTELTNVLLQQ